MISKIAIFRFKRVAMTLLGVMVVGVLLTVYGCVSNKIEQGIKLSEQNPVVGEWVIECAKRNRVNQCYYRAAELFGDGDASR